MSTGQEVGSKKKQTSELLTDQNRAAVKESIMDFAGHFSTASAILAGFYMATCAFIINIRAEGEVFTFLDEPLLAEITVLGDFVMMILTALNLSDMWPTHFEYMLLIFISLFLLSLISYACFLRVGMIQMTMLKSNTTVSEEKLYLWQERGMNSLLISLLFSFITLPWALLRFVFNQALLLTTLLLIGVISGLIIALKGLNLMRSVKR